MGQMPIPLWGSLVLFVSSGGVGAFVTTIVPEEWHTVAFMICAAGVLIGGGSAVPYLYRRWNASEIKKMGIVLLVSSVFLIALGLTVGWVGFRIWGTERALVSKDVQHVPAPNEPKKTTAESIANSGRPLTAAEKRVAQRTQFIEQRQKLEEPLENVEGTLIKYKFPEKGIGNFSIQDGGATYTINISIHGGTGIWIYGDHESIKTLYKIGAASRSEAIDIQLFHAAKRAESLEIGETAILEASDKKLIQVLIVRVRYQGAGDKIDEVHLRYKIHPAGEQPLKAL